LRRPEAVASGHVPSARRADSGLNRVNSRVAARLTRLLAAGILLEWLTIFAFASGRRRGARRGEQQFVNDITVNVSLRGFRSF
jgi:hypothetical protein